jgi:recombination protein RecT
MRSSTKKLTKEVVLQHCNIYDEEFRVSVPDSSFNLQRTYEVAAAEVQKNKRLQECSIESILESVKQACYLGLEPSSVTGEAYLVPYGNRCTLVIGYKGQLELMYRGGHVTSVWAYPIYESDLPNVDIQLGTNPQVKHSPRLGASRGELVAVYACAEIPNSDQVKFDFMTREECDRIRSKSAGAHSKSHPWNTDYEAMCLKSVIKKMSKTISKKQNVHAERLSYASVAAEDTGEGQTITLGTTDFQTLTNQEEQENDKAKESSEAGSGQSNKPSPIEIDKENAPRPKQTRGRKKPLVQQEGSDSSIEESGEQGTHLSAA